MDFQKMIDEKEEVLKKIVEELDKAHATIEQLEQQGLLIRGAVAQLQELQKMEKKEEVEQVEAEQVPQK